MEILKYLQKNILEKLLAENIYLPLEIHDLFQNLLDYREKYLILMFEKGSASSPKILELYLVKMKFVIIQILDEICKDLFKMEEEEEEFKEDMEAEEEEEEEEEKHEKNPPKKRNAEPLYKQFTSS